MCLRASSQTRLEHLNASRMQLVRRSAAAIAGVLVNRCRHLHPSGGLASRQQHQLQTHEQKNGGSTCAHSTSRIQHVHARVPLTAVLRTLQLSFTCREPEQRCLSGPCSAPASPGFVDGMRRVSRLQHQPKCTTVCSAAAARFALCCAQDCIAN
jgi:hypothetical protein